MQDGTEIPVGDITEIERNVFSVLDKYERTIGGGRSGYFALTTGT